MIAKITWRRDEDGIGYSFHYGSHPGTLWQVAPLGRRSWMVYRNCLPVPPFPAERTADGTPRKREQPKTRFWRTPEAAFKAAEGMIRREAGR